MNPKIGYYLAFFLAAAFAAAGCSDGPARLAPPIGIQPLKAIATPGRVTTDTYLPWEDP
jgi:hypothetical protein